MRTSLIIAALLLTVGYGAVFANSYYPADDQPLNVVCEEGPHQIACLRHDYYKGIGKPLPVRTAKNTRYWLESDYALFILMGLPGAQPLKVGHSYVLSPQALKVIQAIPNGLLVNGQGIDVFIQSEYASVQPLIVHKVCGVYLGQQEYTNEMGYIRQIPTFKNESCPVWVGPCSVVH